MSKEETTDLQNFLTPFSDDIRSLTLWLREFVWDLYPDCNELIYDNYNAVAFGWSPSERVNETFCSIAVGSNKYVHFGFYWGTKISDPENKLEGKGNQYRFIKVKDKSDFPTSYITKLMFDAYTYSLYIMKEKNQVLKGATLVKSISKNKKRPK